MTHTRVSPDITPGPKYLEIRAFELFKHMDEAEIDELLRPARTVRIQKGQAVFRQGDPAQNFYLLIEGRLKVVQITEDGHQIMVRIVSPGDLFGIARALRRPDYPGTATAAVDSVVFAWSSSLWENLTDRHPALTKNALHMVARHMQELHSRIREFSTEDVESRVARALTRLVMQAGRRTEEGILIDFPITRQDIAEMIGTTVPTVSRILSSWAESGFVQTSRLRIVVREPYKLLDLVKR